MAAGKGAQVNFFRPATERMRREVGIATTVLLLWAALSFGLPLFIWLAGLADPERLGRSWLTEARFLGFPLHYWLIAQGCTIGYVLLCKLFCRLWDRRLPPVPGSGAERR
jgi:putative solute:sodium symporter small subunit